MPTDWTGEELSVGDRVLIPAIVTDIREDRFAVNLQVSLARVHGLTITFLSMHAVQVEKVRDRQKGTPSMAGGEEK